MWVQLTRRIVYYNAVQITIYSAAAEKYETSRLGLPCCNAAYSIRARSS